MSSPNQRLDRTEVQIGAGREAAAEHEHLRIERVGEVDETERDPPAELVDHRERVAVTLARRQLDVLAADRLGIAVGQIEHPAHPPSDRRLARQARQARNPMRTAPSIRAGRRRTADRTGRRPCGRTRRRTRCGRAGARRRRRHRRRCRCRASPGSCRSSRGRRRGATRRAPHTSRRCRPARRQSICARSPPATSKSATPSRFGAARSTPLAGHQPRHADAERLVVSERPGELDERVDHPVDAARPARCRPAILTDQVAVGVERDTEALRSADVDADVKTRTGHAGRVTPRRAP